MKGAEPTDGGGSAATCPDEGAVQTSSCKKCDPGRFKAGSGSEKCAPCGVGKYCGAGATVMEPCAKGKSSADPKVPCTDCAAGKYQASSGSDQCLACAEGQYSDAGASECISCVANSKVMQSGIGCECVAGFFARNAEQPPKACEVCPKGVNCTNEGNSWRALQLDRGHWQDKTWVKDVDGLLARGVEECKIGSWTGQEDTDPLCIGGSNWTACRKGHRGVKCQACPRTAAIMHVPQLCASCVLRC